MLFREFIKHKALEEKLPFSIDFDVRPSVSDAPLVKVGGFDIPSYNELLPREAFFFNRVLAPVSGSRKIDLQISINLLAKELQSSLKLDTLAIALSSLFSPSEEIAGRPEYEDFLLNNSSRLQQIAQMAELMDNDAVVSWMRVSFFLLSRVDANWTLEKTTVLRQSQIDAVDAFIRKETNGGVDPSELALPEVEEKTDDVGELTPA